MYSREVRPVGLRELSLSTTVFFFGVKMYLLYCDESGTTKDPNQIHYLFSGICTFERQSYWIANEMDKIASTLNPADPHSIEFHGSHILGGKGSWRKVPYSFRNSLII